MGLSGPAPFCRGRSGAAETACEGHVPPAAPPDRVRGPEARELPRGSCAGFVSASWP